MPCHGVATLRRTSSAHALAPVALSLPDTLFDRSYALAGQMLFSAHRWVPFYSHNTFEPGGYYLAGATGSGGGLDPAQPLQAAPPPPPAQLNHHHLDPDPTHLPPRTVLTAACRVVISIPTADSSAR